MVINQVTNGPAAKKAYAQLKTTVSRFLDLRLSPLGVVARDRSVQTAVISQTPFFLQFPDAPASKCIRNISEKLVRGIDPFAGMPLELFWDRCLDFLAGCEEKPARSSALPEPAQKGETGPDGGAIQQMLSEIDQKLSVLTETVASLKQMFEQHISLSEKSPAQSPAGPPPGPAPEPREIELDFESWMNHHSGSRT